MIKSAMLIFFLAISFASLGEDGSLLKYAQEVFDRDYKQFSKACLVDKSFCSELRASINIAEIAAIKAHVISWCQEFNP